MAILHYVKDGPRPDNAGAGYELPISDIEMRLAAKQVRYLGIQPPEFNAANPSLYPIHAVIEIESGEALGRMFPRVGFFLIVDASPSEIGSLVFPNGHPSPQI